MCGQDAIIKFRSLISKTLDWRFEIYFPEVRVVTAERAKLLPVIQDVGDSDDNFHARLREKSHSGQP